MQPAGDGRVSTPDAALMPVAGFASPQMPKGALQVLVLRHGRTEWNIDQRLQGHTDIALVDAARRELSNCFLPRQFAHFHCWSSPLKRAVETASLLCGRTPQVDSRLCEMSWGEWEGRTIKAIETQLGVSELAALSARGRDFRPPGGESPRELQARIFDWLVEQAQRSNAIVAATHKGVLKALLGDGLRLEFDG